MDELLEVRVVRSTDVGSNGLDEMDADSRIAAVDGTYDATMRRARRTFRDNHLYDGGSFPGSVERREAALESYWNRRVVIPDGVREFVEGLATDNPVGVLMDEAGKYSNNPGANGAIPSPE